MTKLKFYKITTISLLLLNIILVSAFLITKPKGGQRGKNRLNAKEHFKMNEIQHDKFLASVDAHHEEMKGIKKKQIDVLKPYLYSVSDSKQPGNQKIVMDVMKDLEEKKLNSMHSHLEEVKHILNEDQLPLF